MSQNTQKEILVIGRGIIGLAAAYRFSEAGYKVTVVGPKQLEGSASQAAVGFSSIKGHTTARTPLFRAKMLGHAGLEQWVKEVELESGQEIPHDFSGVLEPFNSDEEYQALLWRMGRDNEPFPEGAKVLSRDELSSVCEQVDYLNSDIVGGIFFPTDGWYDPRCMMSALEVCLLKRQALFVEHQVLRILPNGISGLDVETVGGIIRSDDVLLAAGIFSDEILINSGLNDLKLISVLGHSLSINANGCRPHATVKSRFSLIGCKDEIRFGSTSFRESANGCAIRKKGFDLLKSEFGKIFNSNREIDSETTTLNWGFRARFKDRLPAVGDIPIGTNRKLSVALGFYKNGMQLADLSARSLVAQKEDKPFHPEVFSSFAPARFQS
jgi:glycine/D-amino acid oxidase-like deaminating enzyme